MINRFFNKQNNKPHFLKSARQLPWEGKYTPHCVLDITRRCNIKCRACYNDDKSSFKSLQDIENELKQILKYRKLQTVLLVGGEPLLHPQLCEIIKLIRDMGLYVETCSNGVLFNDSVAKKLKEAGLNILAFHIESQQERPDLSFNSTKEERNNLRIQKCKIAYDNGIETGLMLTAFKDNISEIDECIDFILKSKEAFYLTITSYINSQNIGKVKGNLETGIISENKNYQHCDLSFNMDELSDIVGKYFNNEPVHFIGTRKKPNNPRWLIYRSISTVDENQNVENYPMKVSNIEGIFMFCHKLFKGSSIFYAPQDDKNSKLHFLFNALFGNFKNLIFYFKNRNKKFIKKIVMVTVEADISANGEVDLCRSCFDAQLKNGKLVPTCLVDNITEVEF